MNRPTGISCLIAFIISQYFLLSLLSYSQPAASDIINKPSSILTGAEQTEVYLPLLRNKRVGLIVNPTSRVGTRHLLDTLLALKINVVKIFAPEHGFRGNAENGAIIKDEIDAPTGLPVYSLHGKTHKPSAESLKDVDVVVFDIQDVGARFFTYISTMHYAMEACAENHKPFIVLDRPNPNGYYIDGPVLDLKYKSFVGMHPIPIVHGLTVGELALMINGEKWLDSGKVCLLHVIPLKNYTHEDRYSLPVVPSPNLPNDIAVEWYPSLCLFEGTLVSVGRGTDSPFQVIGLPDKNNGTFTFTPRGIEGKSNHPQYENIACYGTDLRNKKPRSEINLDYLVRYYATCSDKEKFFNGFFKRLAGTESLEEQIKEGWEIKKIKATWQTGLDKYKALRKKYLLYKDFK